MTFVLGVLNLALGIGLLTLFPDYGHPENNRTLSILGCVGVFVGITCLVVTALT